MSEVLSAYEMADLIGVCSLGELDRLLSAISR